jgi:hypothetical protein
MSARTHSSVRNPYQNPTYVRSVLQTQSLTFQKLSIRFKLLVFGAGFIVLTLVVMSHIHAVYDANYQYFDSIVNDSSVKVEASLTAIQEIADVNKYAADYIGGLTPDAKQKARAELYKAFENFRREMFTIRGGLRQDSEVKNYTTAEANVYQEYWAQISLLIEAQNNQDRAGAIRAFNTADGIFEAKIASLMRTLSDDNYKAMRELASQAATNMGASTLHLSFVLIGLAGAITVLSFWLRLKVRRYLTPGLDAAMVLAWLFAFAIIGQLLALPAQMRTMTEDAYYSITAASRVIADANRANVTESAALNDPAHAADWQQRFDNNIQLIQLRLCGQIDCIKTTFSAARPDSANPQSVEGSRQITPELSSKIGGVKPLMGNITFAGEVAVLEKARIALLDYLKVDSKARTLLATNQLDAALKLNTSESDTAFFRFIESMEQEKEVNKKVFTNVWQSVQSGLVTNQVLYGFVALGLVIVACAAGVYHRYREL